MRNAFLLVGVLLLSACIALGNEEPPAEEKAKEYKPKYVDPDRPDVEDPDHGEEGLPTATDEEYYSKVPPKHMSCDACAATAFWIHRQFKLAHKEKYSKKLKLDQIYDLVDEICLPKTYSRTYGIKNINGKHRLSGGGLKHFYSQAPAVGTAMPGQWLNYQCRQTQGEFGEEELYEMFWKYHVVKKHESSDVPFFRQICIKRLKKCTEAQALETYDGYEAKHSEEKL
jgi:hypothetical protein